jgi:hypothetical protein
MTLDFRYHLASLTAVFAALLLGILLGVAMKEGPALSDQIQDLHTEFLAAKDLTGLNKRAEQYAIRTQHLIVQDRLRDRNVALVHNAATFKDQGALDAVRQSLRDAGATVAVEITLKPALWELSPEELARLYTRMEIMTNAPSVADLMTRLALDLGRGWLPLARTLAAEKRIKLHGDEQSPVSTVVFCGGGPPMSDHAYDLVDLPFLKGCRQRQFRVAAVEVYDTPYSAIPSYTRVVPLTVDNVDHAAGRVALILALANGTYGHYGYKDTANALLPELE